MIASVLFSDLTKCHQSVWLMLMVAAEVLRLCVLGASILHIKMKNKIDFRHLNDNNLQLCTLPSLAG